MAGWGWRVSSRGVESRTKKWGIEKGGGWGISEVANDTLAKGTGGEADSERGRGM